MSNNYFIYNLISGAVLSTASLPEGMSTDILIKPEGSEILEGYADYKTQYVKDGVLLTLSPDDALTYLTQIGNRCNFNFTTMSYFNSSNSAEELDQAKLARWNNIKQLRALKEAEPITYQGCSFDADSSSQQRIMGAIQLALLQPDDWSIQWTLANNSSVDLTKVQLIGLGVAIADRTSQLFNYSQYCRTRINNSKSIEELNLIDW